MLLAWRMARTCGVSPTLPAAGTSKKRRKPYVAHMSGAGSAAMIYLQNNGFDEALERLRMIFDGHDDVIVSMSGGKGRILGVVFGSMSFTIIDKIITALGLNPLINDTIKGAILLLAIAVQMLPMITQKLQKTMVTR